VRLLLDTHVFLWCVSDPSQLSADARERITDPANAVAFSAASAWEIAIKMAAGKLAFDADLPQAVSDATFQELPISIAHALAAGALPPLHRDPFDRMLVAQAKTDGWTLVTRNQQLAKYGVPVLTA
jgi:PIN domain nuclease of toxin-antitoxin system